MVQRAVKDALRAERKKKEYTPGWYPTGGNRWYYWDGWRWHDDEWSSSSWGQSSEPAAALREKGLECATSARVLPPGDEMCRVCELMTSRSKGERPKAKEMPKEPKPRKAEKLKTPVKKEPAERDEPSHPKKKQKAAPPTPSSSYSWRRARGISAPRRIRRSRYPSALRRSGSRSSKSCWRTGGDRQRKRQGSRSCPSLRSATTEACRC